MGGPGGRRRGSRKLKLRLARALAGSGVSLEEVVEWLWEDFGLRAPMRWDGVVDLIARAPEVSPQDIVSFLDEHGITLNEDLWDEAG